MSTNPFGKGYLGMLLSDKISTEQHERAAAHSSAAEKHEEKKFRFQLWASELSSTLIVYTVCLSQYPAVPPPWSPGLSIRLVRV